MTSLRDRERLSQTVTRVTVSLVLVEEERKRGHVEAGVHAEARVHVEAGVHVEARLHVGAREAAIAPVISRSQKHTGTKSVKTSRPDVAKLIVTI